MHKYSHFPTPTEHITIAYPLLQTTHIRQSLQNHAEQRWLNGKQQLFAITGIFKID